MNVMRSTMAATRWGSGHHVNFDARPGFVTNSDLSAKGLMFGEAVKLEWPK